MFVKTNSGAPTVSVFHTDISVTRTTTAEITATRTCVPMVSLRVELWWAAPAVGCKGLEPPPPQVLAAKHPAPTFPHIRTANPHPI